jgi:hypothetical protein
MTGQIRIGTMQAHVWYEGYSCKVPVIHEIILSKNTYDKSRTPCISISVEPNWKDKNLIFSSKSSSLISLSSMPSWSFGPYSRTSQVHHWVFASDDQNVDKTYLETNRNKHKNTCTRNKKCWVHHKFRPERKTIKLWNSISWEPHWCFLIFLSSVWNENSYTHTYLPYFGFTYRWRYCTRVRPSCAIVHGWSNSARLKEYQLQDSALHSK